MTGKQMQDNKNKSWMFISGILAVLLVVSIFTNGFGGTSSAAQEVTQTKTVQTDTNLDNVAISDTFTYTDNEICNEDGKPIIRLFSTTWCPHCKWVGETYERVVNEYVSNGEIVAYHWEIDIKDDTLTSENEGSIPSSELDVYKEFNPRGSIPTFVFGCKYSRVGNGYEREGEAGLLKEEKEFRQIIESLIEEMR